MESFPFVTAILIAREANKSHTMMGSVEENIAGLNVPIKWN